MLSGALAFTQPWILAALVVLPAVWWLLRLIPPAPKLRRFPPIRILLDIAGTEETPAGAPWWLVLLRLVIVALVIVALAGPVLNPAGRLAGSGPLVLIVDDGWTAASHWPRRLAAMDRWIARADRAGRAVVILGTAPPPGPEKPLDQRPPASLLSPEQARARAAAMKPKPWPVDRTNVVARLKALDLDHDAHVVWLSDGLDHGGAAALIDDLRRYVGFDLIADEQPELARALLPLKAEGTDLSIGVVRVSTERPLSLWVRVSAGDGRLLSRSEIPLEAGAVRGRTRLGLPVALRNRIARIEIEGESSAGAVMLVDESWRRRTVGLVSGEGAEAAQPLLSALYYLSRALEPFADLRQGPVPALIESGAGVLMLADVGTLPERDEAAIQGWLGRGGVLVRFAGPKLAEHGQDALLPVRLRSGGRSMGGVLSWEQPAPLAPFDADSPFFGLAIPGDVRVNRQVLAEPSRDPEVRTWARLEDGTPLVTARRKGQGWVVLFHVTANTDWSNLPLSGLFVAMLKRIVALGRKDDSAFRGDRPLAPVAILDGFGRLGRADPAVPPLIPSPESPPRAGAEHPPGLYGSKEAPVALNLMAPNGPIDDEYRLQPLPEVAGVRARPYGTGGEMSLRPWLLAAALLLLLMDGVIGLSLRGLLRRAGPMAAMGLVLVCIGLVPVAPARAQSANDAAPSSRAADRLALTASLQLRFAYALTGDARTDRLSRTALVRLGEVVAMRTTVAPAPPLGIDLSRDELIFFPLVYWPVVDDPAPLPAAAIDRIDRYMKTGGILFIDASSVARPTEALRRALGRLDVPPLMRLPSDHVLNRAFYLLERYRQARPPTNIWVERHAGGVNDGVSSVVISYEDLARQWARGDGTFPFLPPEREIAFRFGINLVMYALTGNYKADQLHLPVLLERLGQ